MPVRGLRMSDYCTELVDRLRRVADFLERVPGHEVSDLKRAIQEAALIIGNLNGSPLPQPGLGAGPGFWGLIVKIWGDAAAAGPLDYKSTISVCGPTEAIRERLVQGGRAMVTMLREGDPELLGQLADGVGTRFVKPPPFDVDQDGGSPGDVPC